MPPRPGDILELTIDSLAYGGQGVARQDDFVVFVRGAVPGDRVRARVGRRKRSYAEARVEELLYPSARRVAPRCRHEADCGGCEWQTIDYPSQLEFKQRQVVESLQHIGGLTDYELSDIRGMKDPWRYRNKMEFSFGRDAHGHTLLGLHRRGSWREICAVEDCLLATERMNAARLAVAAAAVELGLGAYRREDHEGLLRHLVIREGRASGDLLLNLFVARRFDEEQRLAQRVAARQPYTSFAITVNDAPADAAIGEGPFMIVGRPYLRERLAGAALHVPATAFLQTNTEMCEVLYATALAAAQPDSERTTLDLYCGIGALSLALARGSAAVEAIEIQPAAVAAARENARLNDITNVAFAAGDVRVLLKQRLAAAGVVPPAVVVVDPPRAGMARKALQRAAQSGSDRLVYVSCNPTTLAANAAELAQLGYALRRVTPVDMFPHTHHIETVASFARDPRPGGTRESV